MTHLRFLRTAVLALAFVGFGFAQPSGGAATQTVIAFLNIIDHPTVLSTESRVGSDPEDVAVALLDHLDMQGILAPDVSASIRDAIPASTLDRGAFILYLADLLNYTDPLEMTVVVEVERNLESMYCGLTIPTGSIPDDASGAVLDNRDVGTVVQQFLDNLNCIAPGLRDTYGEPVE